MEKMKLIVKLLIVLLITVRPVFSFAATADLLAGTAKVNITSSSEMPLHDSLYARVLLLKTSEQELAFIAVDQGIFTSDKLVQKCKEKLGISQVLISSSHTHSSGGSDKEYIDSQIIKALQEAEKSMFPARISAGSRTFPQLGFNRLSVR